MDDIDRAERVTERERTASIERARAAVADMLGPAECRQCGYPNTRRSQGFATCKDCYEEAA